MRRRLSRNAIAASIIVVLVVLIVVLFAMRGFGSTHASAGKTAPSFSGLSLSGQTVSLDQYRGKPLVVVYMTYT